MKKTFKIKHFLLTICIFYISSVSAQYIKYDKDNVLNQEKSNAQAYAELKVSKLVKGEFEKKADFETRKKESYSEYESKYNHELLRKFTILKEYTYDSENEIFKIQFKYLRPLFLKLPISYASDFKKNFKTSTINFDEIVINGSEIIIVKGYVYSPQIDIRFPFKNELEASYTGSNIKSKDEILYPRIAEFKIRKFNIDSTSSANIIVLKKQNLIELLREKISNILKNDNYSVTQKYYSFNTDEVEKIDEFEKRVKEKRENLNNVITGLALLHIFESKKPNGWDEIKQVKSPSGVFYDAESEVFKITFIDNGPIYIKIPIKYAPEKKSGFEKVGLSGYLNTTDCSFALLDDNTVVVVSFPIFSNYQTYNGDKPRIFYKVFESLEFNGNEIKGLTFEDTYKTIQVPLTKRK